MLGFILPSFLVSCSGIGGFGKPFSLAELSSQANQPLLYLVPLGAIAVLAFSLLPIHSREQFTQFIIGQAAGIVAGVLSILVSLISLNSQINQFGGFKISPEYGLFVLVGGYILVGIGLGIQWNALGNRAWGDTLSGTSRYRQDEEMAPFPPAVGHIPLESGPRLEPVQGDFPYAVIPLTQGSLSIGRSKECDLHLSDARVSRRHALIRTYQGMWFIQDQGSSGGTFVNGRRVEATRLNPGDRITIGGITFVFRI
jgi:hypothetical protein